MNTFVMSMHDIGYVLYRELFSDEKSNGMYTYYFRNYKTQLF